MSRILVVYFSRTGHTGQIAGQLAAALGADVERIREPRDRTGFFGYWRSGREGWLGRTTTIEPASKRPSDYDVVLLGTPVWSGHVSSPVRTYAIAHAGEFGNLALFCTLGGAGADRTLAETAALCGAEPVATLAVTEKELAAGDYASRLRAFVERVLSAASGTAGPDSPSATP